MTVMDIRIKVSGELHAQITALADHHGLTIDKWVRSQIEQHVRQQVKLAHALIQLAEPGNESPQSWAYIYFIRFGAAGDIKIGRTFDVAGRLKSLQTACPEPLELLACVREDETRTEAAFHKQFAQFRKNGEWFEAAKDVLDCIALIRSEQ